MNNKLALMVGIMSIFIILYRITVLMIPMITLGIKNKNIYQIFSALTLLV